jgi:hypothetical protein
MNVPGQPVNSIFVAHVADVIRFYDAEVSDDTAARRAAGLLSADPRLTAAADAYSQGTVGAVDFYNRVREAEDNAQ